LGTQFEEDEVCGIANRKMKSATQGTMNNERDDDTIKKIVEIASALPRKMIVVLKPGQKY
jgi:hypothetical protein